MSDIRLWELMAKRLHHAQHPAAAKWTSIYTWEKECCFCENVAQGQWLTRCSHIGCSAWFHPLCAAKQLIATERRCGIHGEDVPDPEHVEADLRVISFTCPAHSTWPVFCSCKRPDDFSGKKYSIRCDSCCDWYHTSCEGVADEVLDEEFTCNDCRERGKPASCEVRADNTAKCNHFTNTVKGRNVIVLAFWLKTARMVTDNSSKWNVPNPGNALAVCLQMAELFISAQDMIEEQELHAAVLLPCFHAMFTEQLSALRVLQQKVVALVAPAPVLAIRSGMSQFSSAGTTTAVNGIAATGVGHNVQGGQLDDSAQRSRRTSKRRHDDGRTHKHKRVCSGEDSNGDDNTDTDSSLGHAASLDQGKKSSRAAKKAERERTFSQQSMSWPPWVRVALKKTGCSTAGYLHNFTRAYSEVARLNTHVKGAGELDVIASVAKPSRIKYLGFYKQLWAQKYPFKLPEARGMFLRKLLMPEGATIGEHAQKYFLKAKTDEASVHGLNLRQIKEYLDPTNDRWKQWDTEFSGPLSVKTAGVD